MRSQIVKTFSGYRTPSLGAISSGRYNNLNLLRLVAAAAVLVGHCWPLLYGPAGDDPISEFIRPFSPFQRGMPGIAVYVFFFISGFLVTRSIVERGDIIEYALSRILRIYPALIIVTILLVFGLGPVFTSLSLQEYVSHPQTVKYFSTNIVMWNVAFTLPGVFSEHVFKGVNGSLWTLPAEIRCYVLVGCFWALGLFSNKTVFNACAVGLAVGGYLFREHLVFFEMKGQLKMAYFFLIGAAFYINRDSIRLSPGVFAALLILTIMLRGQPLYHVSASILMCAAVAWFGFAAPVIASWLNDFGDISYGVYIYAYPVQQTIIALSDRQISPWLLLLYATPIVAGLACVSWFLIEKPALNFKKRLIRRIRGDAKEP